MRKLLLASLLALASGTAAAQFTVSGKIAEYIDNTKVGNTSKTTMYHEPTSNIAFTAVEKIGGVTASAVLETSLFGNNVSFGDPATRLGDRQKTVGLAGGMGSVDFGRNVHSHFLAITINDAFSTLYGSVAGELHGAFYRGLRLSDAVYVNVTPMKNVSFQYEATQGLAKDVRVMGTAATLGPINARLARWEQGSEQSTVLGMNARPAKNTTVSYIYSKDDGVKKDTAHSVGVVQRMGVISLKGTYGKTDSDTKAYALGADYHLSKRTEIGLAYNNFDRSHSADSRTLGLGLVHRF